MTHFHRFCIFLALSAFFAVQTPHAAVEKAIALTLKVKGSVRFKPVELDSTSQLKFGAPLDNGDWVKTESDGFCAFIFTDDKSQVKINANTEVVIQGERDNQSNIAKRVSIEVGELFARVDKQRGSLQIATPTSVASVKGTEFWVIVLEDGSTEVVTLTGLVELVNRISGRIVEIRPGQQGSSNSDGEVEVGAADPDIVPDLPEEDEESDQSIDIELEDSEGKPKTIRIRYRRK